MNIGNSIALVTGANRGIGSALVEALLDRFSHRVYAAVRNPVQLEKSISKFAGRIVPLRMDITRQDDVSKAVSIASDINILINNAGVFSEGNLLDTPLNLIRRNMDVNYFGTLNVVRAFASVMELNGGGSIVNILSISALASSPGIGAYSASKAATYSLTQALRAQLTDKGISVHAVFPGPVDTDMTSEMNIQKANSYDVARAILDGVEMEEEDIFPDKMSRQAGSSWRNDPKILERQLAAT